MEKVEIAISGAAALGSMGVIGKVILSRVLSAFDKNTAAIDKMGEAIGNMGQAIAKLDAHLQMQKDKTQEHDRDIDLLRGRSHEQGNVLQVLLTKVELWERTRA